MNIEQCTTILTEHNRWRRGGDMSMANVKELGEAIDFAVERLSWKPISTAPEGEILIKGGKAYSDCGGTGKWFDNEEVFIAKKYSGDDYYVVNDYFNVKPTHWMEIPR